MILFPTIGLMIIPGLWSQCSSLLILTSAAAINNTFNKRKKKKKHTFLPLPTTKHLHSS